MTRRTWLFVPLGLFLLFVVAVAWRLSSPPDTTIRSRSIGKPVPAFVLPAAIPGKPGLRSADLQGSPRLVNIFASWCIPCIAEAPVLSELRGKGVAIEGIALRDGAADVSAFLADNGDPYNRIGSDLHGQVQIALGSSGVPESFVVDRRGVIRYQHIGPIMPQDVPTILAEWRKAQ